MKEFDQFIGKSYGDVNNQITDLAKAHGWQAVPWPVGIGMVALDETTLIVEIKSDIDDIIVSIKRDI